MNNGSDSGKISSVEALRQESLVALLVLKVPGAAPDTFSLPLALVAPAPFGSGGEWWFTTRQLWLR